MSGISTLEIFSKLCGRRHHRLLAESDLREDLRFFVVIIHKSRLKCQKIQGIWKQVSCVTKDTAVAEFYLPGHGYATLANNRVIETTAKEYETLSGVIYELYVTPKILDTRTSIHNRHRRDELAEHQRFVREATASAQIAITEAAAA